MAFWKFGQRSASVRTGPSQRKALRLMTIEGIPATIIGFLLGGPFQTSYLLYLGASSVQIGIALALPSLANVVQVIGAVYMQRFANRRIAVFILAGLHRTIWTLTGLIPFLFDKEHWMVIYLPVFAVSFICNSLGAVVRTSHVADLVPPAVRGSYFGFRNMVLTGVGVVCLLAGGLLLDHFPGARGFQIFYWIAGVMTAWNIVALYLYPTAPFEKSQETAMGRMFLTPFKDRAFNKAMMFLSLWLFLQGMGISMFNYVMQKIMHVSYSWVSAITIVQNVVMMLSYVVWGRLDSKYPTRVLLFWTLPIIAASCLIWGLAGILPTLLLLVLVHILFGFGTGGYNLLVFNFIIGDTPKSDRPMFLGVFSAITGIAGFLGPFLGGYLFEWLADAPAWVLRGGVFAGIGVLLAITIVTAGYSALLPERERPLGEQD